MPERFIEAFWIQLDELIKQTEVVVDRPKGSEHPTWPDVTYPLDYGYLAGTTSSDGAGIDVWVGASGKREAVALFCTVDLLKRDAELKILLGCTEAEMLTVAEFLNQSEAMSGLIVRRLE